VSAGQTNKVPAYLKKAVEDLVRAAVNDKKASLTDKCKAIDRGLKLAAIEAKMEDAGFGSGFADDSEPEETT